MADLGEFLGRRGADLAIGGVRIDKFGELLFKRGVTPAQRVIVGIGNGRRILPVIALVMLGDLGLKPRVLFPRLGEGELWRFRLFRHGSQISAAWRVVEGDGLNRRLTDLLH